MTHDTSCLVPYIIQVPNAITPQLCDALLAEYQGCDDWVNTVVGNIPNTVNKNIRSAMTIGISFPHIIDKHVRVRKPLDRYVHATAGHTIKTYKTQFPLSQYLEEDSGYELLRYNIGNHYIEHTDSSKSRPRTVSCTFALNDEYTGGEFSFFQRSHIYNLAKGDALLFPSNFMFPHEIMPILSGTRYALVTWFI